MYVDCDSSVIYQGDIIDYFVFTAVAQPDSAVASEEDIVADPRYTHGPAMIVSNTCDITRRKFVSIVRIFPLQGFIDAHRANGKSENNIASEISQLKSQKLFYYFYIPGDTSRGVEEGYADLTFINPLETNSLSRLKRLASLDAYQRHILAYKLGNLFMRPH